MSWVFSDAAASFGQHAAEWDALNALTGHHILLDAVSVQAQLDHLVTQPVLLAHWTGRDAPAMLLLQRAGAGRWRSFQPSQQPLANVLFSQAAAVDGQLAALMRQLPGCALMLGITAEDPAFSRCLQAAGTAVPISTVERLKTGCVHLQQSFAAYWQQRPHDLRSGVARRRRRLAREGCAPTLAVLQDPGQVAAAVQQYSQLEATGWKAGAGTSVGLADRQGRFYTALLTQRCRQGEGTIYQLRWGDRVLASQLCVQRGGMSVSLKMAYDESRRADAPGYLLQAMIIEHLHSGQHTETIEFYGRATEGWTLKWTEDLRTLYHLDIYRSRWVQQGLHLARKLLRRPAAGAGGQPPAGASAEAPAA